MSHINVLQYTIGMHGKLVLENTGVYIIFQTVRYHNFAQFCISYAAVAKCTCRWHSQNYSASQIAAQLVNVTTEQRDGSNR